VVVSLKLRIREEKDRGTGGMVMSAVCLSLYILSKFGGAGRKWRKRKQ